MSDATVFTPRNLTLFGIPLDFILFGLTLLGVAVFHYHTMRVALAGLATITIYKILFTGFRTGNGVIGFVSHLQLEWAFLVNLLCLLTGFAVLSRHFEKSHIPLLLPRFLPHDWRGGFILLAMVWVLSSFLDNIAGALIGGAMARQLFRAKVHIGYLAAIVAAANAGGAWSVLGDTTTAMMWIAVDGTPKFTVPAPPESFLQLVQWQTRSVFGSASTSNSVSWGSRELTRVPANPRKATDGKPC